MKRALISVSDKEGIVPLAKSLEKQGIEIISTGGTSRVLEESGVQITGISDVTGFPEILDGRVKTLHPNIHSGLLARRSNDDHTSQLREHSIEPIDLVIVNLYPFKKTIENPDKSFEDAIENIDIGGPAMLRAAAKNFEDVTVVVDPDDYELVLTELKDGGTVSAETNKKLAAKVFRHTASYDALIADYLTKEAGEKHPEMYTVTYEKKQDLRYGENPHQEAAFYREPIGPLSSIANAFQLHGKELSYNNINDAEAALSMIREFTHPASVAVKHMNPCGVAIGETLEEAYDKTYAADPVSIFGGIVAFNGEVTEAIAEKLKEIFLEIVIAPSFSQEALDLLTQKKNIRLLTVTLEGLAETRSQLTSIHGGLLVQDEDTKGFLDADVRVVTEREPTEAEWEDLKLAWKVVKHVKSNAIVLTKNVQTIGIGAGQMNRVGSAEIAINQAGEEAANSALGSDAFFPMQDTVETAGEAGISAIIQPGGSIRDQESIDRANELGITMVFTGMRHFKH
ncbi:bifunctional phosphoribosylaminoimidazolecarboxamide formyltransferase/IMP cyclohydrolase [Marinococcus halophilus]|uniref:Bifunctional purine biosynthesis protein PurH n=1 Tax=Marinococcus halophilus TaxID=1371 RepID=A0A510Y5P3_MARHA|nr:bifunctional phosphoribosylaminoimidazolecarboxamide formyltransferase/IMP cyclohydrolase [Marinococcus halophilus]OZT79850.1 bifunctional phosphoribosylaminoimidazolecarboxamide formyltransferase/IMP cyclohydrolase [Marinococcus halophilus]GEK58672.1 bifunctional purine biosynthesis protein PurH [Marinococcus halophilus]